MATWRLNFRKNVLRSHSAPDNFFFQSVLYWSNLKPVNVGPTWDSRISIHFADNLIVILSLYILCPLSAIRTQRSVLIFRNYRCVIWLWLIYGSQNRKVLGLTIKLNCMYPVLYATSLPWRTLECRNNHFANHMNDVPLWRYDQNWKRDACFIATMPRFDKLLLTTLRNSTFSFCLDWLTRFYTVRMLKIVQKIDNQSSIWSDSLKCFHFFANYHF